MSETKPQPQPGKAGAAESATQFHVGVTWEGDGAGHGFVTTGDGAQKIAIGAAAALDGSGHGTNPEELFISAVGSCFVATWAIFLKKLGIPYAAPALKVSARLEKDPAGGYHLTRMDIGAVVPSSLLASRRAEIEKTLSLTEKYCIVSKAARAAMPVEVRIVEV